MPVNAMRKAPGTGNGNDSEASEGVKSTPGEGGKHFAVFFENESPSQEGGGDYNLSENTELLIHIRQ